MASLQELNLAHSEKEYLNLSGQVDVERLSAQIQLEDHSLFQREPLPRLRFVVGSDGALWFTEQLGGKIGRITRLRRLPKLPHGIQYSDSVAVVSRLLAPFAVPRFVLR
jgi:hypothetical protein